VYDNDKYSSLFIPVIDWDTVLAPQENNQNINQGGSNQASNPPSFIS
jgi:hypothetical protein